MRMEALADRFQQFGGRVQVDLGSGNGRMADVRRKRGQFGEKVRSVAIPREEAIHAKTVPRIVDPSSLMATRSANPELADNRHKGRGKGGI